MNLCESHPWPYRATSTQKGQTDYLIKEAVAVPLATTRSTTQVGMLWSMLSRQKNQQAYSELMEAFGQFNPDSYRGRNRSLQESKVCWYHPVAHFRSHSYRHWDQSIWMIITSWIASANSFRSFPAIQEKPHSCTRDYRCWSKCSILLLLWYVSYRDSDWMLTTEPVFYFVLILSIFTTEGN